MNMGQCMHQEEISRGLQDEQRPYIDYIVRQLWMMNTDRLKKIKEQLEAKQRKLFYPYL